MASVDIVIIAFYFLLVIGVGFYFSRRQEETSETYFLAGRNLGWFVIGCSIFAANISSEHFIGLAGYGASRGLAVGNIEWLAIFALMLLGWYLAPIFIKSKVFTVPEFLGKRFNNTVRWYLSGISIVAYLLTKISISLYAAGLLLHQLLGWNMYTSGIVMLVITGIYTITGGLKAVVYTSVVQMFFLVGGAIVLTLFGLHEVGGIAALKEQLPADYFSIFKPVSDPDFPWTGIVFGAPILAIWYWCTDQYVVQRILGAKDVNAARSGALLTGLLKILPVFILVLPGLIAMAIFPGVNGDDAYPTLLTGALLPAGFKGLVLAGLLAALMSSLSASFISASTLFTMDFYRFWRPHITEKKLVLIGRLTTTAIVIIGVLWIPLVKLINTHIYIHLQSIQAYISPPIAAVFLMGVFWKRANAAGAIWTLILGGILGLLRLVFEWLDHPIFLESPLLNWFVSMNFLHFAIFLFVISTITMIAVSVITAAPASDSIKEYLVSRSNSLTLDAAVPVACQVKSNRFNRLLSATLLVILFGLWGMFF